MMIMIVDNSNNHWCPCNIQQKIPSAVSEKKAGLDGSMQPKQLVSELGTARIMRKVMDTYGDGRSPTRK